MRSALPYLIPLAISLLLLELGCWALAKTGVLHMPVPSYAPKSERSSLAKNQTFWADINPHWGVWHNPGSQLEHKKSCFSATYQANSHGMRDPERAVQSDTRRIAFLGDSMVEGYGVNRDQRLTTLLENSSNTEVLNFGTAGDFGPTQYYLIYQHLVQQFSHDLVIIGMLPGNDFRDDDLEFGRVVYADRYRPYWTGKAPDYELVYHRENLTGAITTAAKPQPKEQISLLEDVKTLLRTYTYSYNALWYVKRVMIMKESMVSSGFYDYTAEQLHKAQHSFRLIAEAAGNRPVLLVLLPLEQDLIVQATAETPSPLAREMHEFTAANGMLLLDLLPLMSAQAESSKDYYFECDGHWNAYGNQVVQELIYRYLTEQNLL